MNTMRYKGFIGSVGYSEKDDVFFGKIEGIDGLVNFEGQSVTELKNAFHEAVDYYIDFCKREGRPAHREYSGTLNVRLTPEAHSQIAALAKMEGISINAFIKEAVDARLAAMQI